MSEIVLIIMLNVPLPYFTVGSSSAGLLMVSDSVNNCLLTQSLEPGTNLNSAVSQYRKRHKSAGDHLQNKIRSNSLFANFRMRYFSEEDKMGMKFSDLMAKETSEDNTMFAPRETTEDKTQVSDMKDISEEIKDSGVALDENETNSSCGEADNLEKECSHSVECDSENVDKSEAVDDDTVTDTSECDKDMTSSEITSDDAIKTSDVTDTTVELRKGEIGKNIRSIKSYSSPLHSIPVTENDPLGLFIEPSVEKLEKRTKSVESPNSSPQKNRENFMASKPFANFELQKKVESSEGQGQCNTDNSSGTEELTKEGRSSSVINSPVENFQKKLYTIERTFSFPEDLGHGAKGQPFKSNRSGSVQTDQGTLIHSSTSLNDSIKSDAKAEFRLFRTGSFRRHKDNFSGMLKFATGAVASKLSEIKLSMTPSKLGSRDSLTPSIEENDTGSGEDEQYRESRKKIGSIDYLKRSTDTLDSTGHTNGSVPGGFRSGEGKFGALLSYLL